MPTDALIQLQASVTKTATFNGSALTLPGGTPRRGLKARVIYSAASNASGSNTVVFSIDVSRDGGSTWYPEFQADTITLSTTAQSGEIFIPFDVSPSSVGSTNGVQIRLTATVAGGGSTPTITYGGEIVLGRP
jgi:hypothetical protein